MTTGVKLSELVTDPVLLLPNPMPFPYVSRLHP